MIWILILISIATQILINWLLPYYVSGIAYVVYLMWFVIDLGEHDGSRNWNLFRMIPNGYTYVIQSDRVFETNKKILLVATHEQGP